MSVAGVCTAPGEDGVGICGREVFRDDKCAAHMKQLQRTRKMVPIDTRTPKQRVIDAKEELNDAVDGSDDEYEKAERAFWRAIDAYAKRNEDTEFLKAAEAHQRRCSAIRAGIAKRRAKGLLVGSAPKVAPKDIASLVQKFRRPTVPPLHVAVKKTADRLGLSERTVWRALRAVTDKGKVTVSNKTEASPDSPQPG